MGVTQPKIFSSAFIVFFNSGEISPEPTAMPPYRADVTIRSAKDLKNVNWRYGDLVPYVVIWIDPQAKHSSRVADNSEEDTSPIWNETLNIDLPPHRLFEDSTLHIDLVHYGASADTKPLIGSVKIPLKEILDDVSIGEPWEQSVKLRRPSGRPQGKLNLEIVFRDLQPYYAPPPPAAYPAPYGYPAPPPPAPYPSGYPYTVPPYTGRQPEVSYGYGNEYARTTETPKSKYGMGTGIAVGAAAGLLGGLALAEGVEYVEDKIAEDIAEKVEDDLRYDDGDF